MNASSFSFSVTAYNISAEKAHKKATAIELKIKKILAKEVESSKKKGYTVEFEIHSR